MNVSFPGVFQQTKSGHFRLGMRVSPVLYNVEAETD